MSDTRAIWRQRVSSWRASGQSAEKFSARHGVKASTLKWWASQFRRAEPVPVVRVAQVLRSSERTSRHGAIVVEDDTRMRVTVEPGADREALLLVFDLLGLRAR